MLDDNYLMLGPKVDLNKVEKLSTKRLASFLNFFVSQTVTFLNQFASTCEQRLNRLDAKMQDIETLLFILESKLSSVPGLDDLKPPPTTAQNILSNPSSNMTLFENDASNKDTETAVNAVDADGMSEGSLENRENAVSDVGEGTIANKNNPLYKRYFTMLGIGIPMEAVKQKMLMEQMDPGILNKPNELGELPSEEEG